jgi:ribonuclease P protein subunit POP4
MDYNNRNIVLNELIGLKARVIKSLDKKQRGLSGVVIDETKNTVVLETSSGTKSIVKRISVFRFYSGKNSFTVDGEEIGFRPHERIEKSMKFYKARKV